MSNRDDIIGKIRVLLSTKAELKVYRDVIAYLVKNEATLQRKLNDATKKKDRQYKTSPNGHAYLTALNDTILLQYQIVETPKLRLTLSEVALQISDDSEQTESVFSDMTNHL